MNRKLLSFAVAAAMAAPLAAQADVTIYGQVDMSVDIVDYETSKDIFQWPRGELYTPRGNCGLGFVPPIVGCAQFPGLAGTPVRGAIDAEVDNLQISSNASRLGFKGDEDLGNGLSAVWKMEFGIDVDGDRLVGPRATGSEFINLRNAYAGLAHDAAGTLLLGRHDTPYKVMHGSWDIFAESFADDDLVFAGTPVSGFADRRNSNVIAYISPTVAGVTFAAAGFAGENNFNDGLFTDGAGYSLAASGGWGPIKAAIGYEQANQWDGAGAIGNPQGTIGIDRGLNAPWAAGRYLDDDTLWGAGLAWDAAPFYVGVRYEDRENVGNRKGLDVEQLRFSASFSFGNNVVKAMYHMLDSELANAPGAYDWEADAWAIGIDHNLSKRTALYANYTEVDNTVDGFWGGPANGGPMFAGNLRTWGGAVLGVAGTGMTPALDGDGFSVGIFHQF